MAGFHFEHNLPHQTAAVDAVLSVFSNLTLQTSHLKNTNPSFERDPLIYAQNLKDIQRHFEIDSCNSKYHDPKSSVLDVSMETGTGKTYTYTKTIFEMNKQFGLHKFIIVVPTLSIKAGTINFLKSDAAKEHFRQIYHKEIKLYIVDSQKQRKKRTFPQDAIRFAQVSSLNPRLIHVLIINGGMINSSAMTMPFEGTLFEGCGNLFDAISHTRPITIIDEPHKFALESKTLGNIHKFNSQFILRYGATFKDYQNLVYELTALDAFNQDLVKGIVAHTETFDGGEKSEIVLKNIDEQSVSFEQQDQGTIVSRKLLKGQSFSFIHEAMSGLFLDKMNRSTVVLSNGLELRKGDKINPFSYSETLQDKMMAKAVAHHFALERKLLTREVRIKPLTLFFIQDIESYRGNKDQKEHHQGSESLKLKIEQQIKAHAEELLITESHAFYRAYLEQTLQNISSCHGGYFSKDNSESDESIAQEVNEILHDKESLLSLDNPRRFIFSKWTLREGWDNPNVFQICKLRSSGSHISKLQEVGRGLRLPVNEYMNRVKDEKFDLHYYVDFTEQDFVSSLVDEINQKSGVTSSPKSLTKVLIHRILQEYPSITSATELIEKMMKEGIFHNNHDFTETGYAHAQKLFPKAFRTLSALKKGKIRQEGSKGSVARLRAGKYDELKTLWESLHRKVILEYKLNEEQFLYLFTEYLSHHKDRFKPQGSLTKTHKLRFNSQKAFAQESGISVYEDILPLITLTHREFLITLAQELMINLKTLRKAFASVSQDIPLHLYRNRHTIHVIKDGFNKYLFDHVVANLQVKYHQISRSLHPTFLTADNGQPHTFIEAPDRLGRKFDEGEPSDKYLFDTLFYDSDLEKQNMIENIQEVTVFTKIPKGSMRIPVAGGYTYSPDFAYVITLKNGQQQLNLIIETKDKEDRELFPTETQKIAYAQEFFKQLNPNISIKFKAQYQEQQIKDVVLSCLQEKKEHESE